MSALTIVSSLTILYHLIETGLYLGCCSLESLSRAVNPELSCSMLFFSRLTGSQQLVLIADVCVTLQIWVSFADCVLLPTLTNLTHRHYGYDSNANVSLCGCSGSCAGHSAAPLHGKASDSVLQVRAAM